MGGMPDNPSELANRRPDMLLPFILAVGMLSVAMDHGYQAATDGGLLNVFLAVTMGGAFIAYMLELRGGGLRK
jgi:hypothetical protein